MKYLVLLMLVACGSNEMSTSKKTGITFRISLLTLEAQKNFDVDSMLHRRRYIEKQTERNHILKLSEQTLADHLNREMTVFSRFWNDPYSIKKDRFLTFDKYIDYCKTHGKDPEKYIDFLD